MSKPKQIEKLNEGIYSVRGTWSRYISFPATRSFIIANSGQRKILVIDTCGPGSGKIIADSLISRGLNPAEIAGIALTQWHGDHTGGLSELVSIVSEAGGGPVKVFIHEDDADIFLKQKGEFIKIHPALKLPLYHKPGKIPPDEKYVLVRLKNQMDVNPLEDWGVDFIHTPGHTPGHLSFYHRDSMSLFSGSGLSSFGENIFGIVPVFHDRDMQVESGRKLMGINFRYLYPSHMILADREMPLCDRVPFSGRIPVLYRAAGLLPLFRN